MNFELSKEVKKMEAFTFLKNILKTVEDSCKLSTDLKMSQTFFSFNTLVSTLVSKTLMVCIEYEIVYIFKFLFNLLDNRTYYLANSCLILET